MILKREAATLDEGPGSPCAGLAKGGSRQDFLAMLLTHEAGSGSPISQLKRDFSLVDMAKKDREARDGSVLPPNESEESQRSMRSALGEGVQAGNTMPKLGSTDSDSMKIWRDMMDELEEEEEQEEIIFCDVGSLVGNLMADL